MKRNKKLVTDIIPGKNINESNIEALQSSSVNTLGEFDVSWIFWSNWMRENSHMFMSTSLKQKAVLVISTIDTDLMFISSLVCAYNSDAVKDLEIRVRFDATP